MNLPHSQLASIIPAIQTKRLGVYNMILISCTNLFGNDNVEKDTRISPNPNEMQQSRRKKCVFRKYLGLLAEYVRALYNSFIVARSSHFCQDRLTIGIGSAGSGGRHASKHDDLFALFRNPLSNHKKIFTDGAEEQPTRTYQAKKTMNQGDETTPPVSAPNLDYGTPSARRPRNPPSILDMTRRALPHAQRESRRMRRLPLPALNGLQMHRAQRL